MPETRVLIIEPDREESDRAAMRIRLDYPDADVKVVANMNEAAHALEGREFDLVLYSPMNLSTIGGKRSPITEIASYLSKYNVPVMALTPNTPPLYVKQAIDAVPGVEAITQSQFQQVLDALEQIMKRKSGGTAHRIEVDSERTKAKLEAALSQLAELRAEVKEIAADNWKQEQALIEVRNQFGAIATTLTDLRQRIDGLSSTSSNLSKLVDDLIDLEDRDSKMAIARLDAASKNRGALATAIAMITVGILTWFGTANGGRILDYLLPPRHSEPPPKTSPPPKK